MPDTSAHKDTCSCDHRFQNCSQYPAKWSFTHSILFHPKQCYRVGFVQRKSIAKGIQGYIVVRRSQTQFFLTFKFTLKHGSRERQCLQTGCCRHSLFFSFLPFSFLCFPWTGSLVKPGVIPVRFLAHNGCSVSMLSLPKT